MGVMRQYGSFMVRVLTPFFDFWSEALDTLLKFIQHGFTYS